MESRRTIARELALLTISQLRKNIEKLENTDIIEIIELSVESLTKEAEHNLQTSVRELSNIREYIQNYEIDHDDNLSKPVESSIIPVAIPLTSDMTGRIDMLLDAAERLYAAMDIVAIAAMAERNDIKNYTVRLVKTFYENKLQIDKIINDCAKGWDIDRMLKIDRDILRISVTELTFFEDIPTKVSIDEAVELAKKYGTEESSAFINGILRQVFETSRIESKKN